MAADARTLELPAASFDRVVIAAALQHFEPGEVVRMFRLIVGALKSDGLLLVTDLPDAARMWKFHDSVDREDAYFESEANDTPILGTWFDRTWMEKLGRHVGFTEVSALDQPPTFPYALYRFDLRCHK
jgi:ubiquinone/menaquinone biosynthesis C-methylase UbiE